MTLQKLEALADMLEAWAPLIASGYEVPAAAQVMHEAAAALRSAAVGWQPIETAPKDGTEFDAWIDGEFPGRRELVSWRVPTDSEWWAHGGDTIETPDATWHDCFGPIGKSEPLTHWRPLPAPPTAKLEGRDDG